MADQERVVIVNMTTWKDYIDPACILDVGDHPFIRHRTCVNYRDAKIVPLAKLFALKDAGMLELVKPLSAALLKRIRDAVNDSWMELGPVEILCDQGVIEDG